MTSAVKLPMLGFVALLMCAAISLSIRPGTLYWDVDGQLNILFADQTFRYAASPVDLSVVSGLMGMGGLLPPYGVWIHPAYLPLLLDPEIFDFRVTSYFVMIVLMSLATFGLARTMNLSAVGATVCAQIVVVFFFPPIVTHHFSEMSLATMYPLGADAALPTILAVFFVIVLYQIGRGSWWRTLVAMAGLPSIVVYSILCDPMFTTVLFAHVAIISGGVLVGSPDFRVFGIRLAALVVCLCVLLALNVQDFYYGLSTYSARLVFQNEIAAEVQQFDFFTGFAFQNAISALAMLAVAVCGVVTVVLGCRRQRCFAVSVLVLLALILLLSLVYVFSGYRWNLPAPSYVEHGVLPSYLVTLGMGTTILSQRLIGAERSLRIAGWLRGSGVVAVPVAGLVYVVLCVPVAAPVPETEGPVIEQLEEGIRLDETGRFRGALANVVAVPGGAAARLMEIPDYAPFMPRMAELRRMHLNAPLNQFSLWSRGIPTLEEYNQLITPPYYYLFSRAFSRDIDYQSRNYLVITRIRPKLLAALGARYVLTDQELTLEGVTPVCQEQNLLGIDLRLFEIEDPNVGNYSPVNVIPVASAGQAIEAMIADDFSFRTDVVLTAPPDDLALVPASHSAMFFERGGVRVVAKSPGNSLLVLPVQFSHSRKVVSPDADRQQTVQLVRANLVQTGVLFSGAIEIKIVDKFGLFQGLEERKQDIADCRQLQIVEDGTVPYPHNLQPYSLWHHP